MARFNCFNSVRKIAGSRAFLAWGKNGGVLLFAALLIVCSLTVGCSSDKPKPVSSTNPVTQTPGPVVASTTPAPIAEAAKPAPKKVVHKRPATLTYADKSSGVSFQYPRKYTLKTGDDAGKLVASIPLPMDFVQPGGVALATVELPGSVYNGNDLAAAFFNVSQNKSLTEAQCGQFAVPQAEPSAPANPAVQAAAEPSKLILGDMELMGTEAIAGEGTRQSDAKYFHVFENGGCFEFSLNVTTSAPESELQMKHVDREKAFQQMEKILATVKIETVAAPEFTAAAPAPATPETPAQ